MGLIDRIRSELIYLKGALRTLKRVTPIAENRTRTWPDVAEELAAQYGDRPALICPRERHTFTSYNARGNQVARWAQSQGVGKGDCVALFMPNRADYLPTWLGIARAGGTSALLNTQLHGPSLAHCINIVSPKLLIVDAALMEHFATVEDKLPEGCTVWFYDENDTDYPRLDTALAEIDDSNLPAEAKPSLTIDDTCLYIYTSGTTGLPKAAKINHFRVQSIMNGFSAATQATQDDRIYVCLPLYHTAGGVLATGTVLTVGGSVVIGEKFSARTFWDDVVDNNCTMFQYIGELCRYLLNCPTHPKETAHNLRIISGNGLRPDIWAEFKNRFRIPKILEWYAATEGNAVFFNFDEKVGAVGRIPKWAEKKFVTEVVKFDIDEEEPIRDAQGNCIKADFMEVGEVISKIVIDPKRPSQRFDGYADKAATEKKILRDVFEKGDAWFRSGDLMKKDELGYYYFIDRIGDTFRWKGENVATSEVGETMTAYPGINEINVYGVAVPHSDGRAGMAALVNAEDVDFEGLPAFLDKNLPDYAHPRFIRLMPKLDLTGTFKIRKVDLVKEGFNPGTISDELYYLDCESNTYKPLDAGAYSAIEAGEIRL